MRKLPANKKKSDFNYHARSFEDYILFLASFLLLLNVICLLFVVAQPNVNDISLATSIARVYGDPTLTDLIHVIFQANQGNPWSQVDRILPINPYLPLPFFFIKALGITLGNWSSLSLGLFVSFISISLYCVNYVIVKATKRFARNVKIITMLSLGFLSFPVLYSLSRGNLSLIFLPSMYLILVNGGSIKKIVNKSFRRYEYAKEFLHYFLLIAFKPQNIFILLLQFPKRMKDFLAYSLISGVLVIIGFAYFPGRLTDKIIFWLNSVLAFASADNVDRFIYQNGSILGSIISVATQFGSDTSAGAELIYEMRFVVTLLFVFLSVGALFLANKRNFPDWFKLLLVANIMIFAPGVSYFYNYSVIILGLCIMLKNVGDKDEQTLLFLATRNHRINLGLYFLITLTPKPFWVETADQVYTSLSTLVNPLASLILITIPFVSRGIQSQRG